MSQEALAAHVTSDTPETPQASPKDAIMNRLKRKISSSKIESKKTETGADKLKKINSLLGKKTKKSSTQEKTASKVISTDQKDSLGLKLSIQANLREALAKKITSAGLNADIFKDISLTATNEKHKPHVDKLSLIHI